MKIKSAILEKTFEQSLDASLREIVPIEVVEPVMVINITPTYYHTNFKLTGSISGVPRM